MTLATLALVLKIAVPAGYMIDNTADGGPALVLCTAQGPVAIRASDSGHQHIPEAPTKAGHDAPCAFAGHGAAFVASEPPPVALAEPYVYVPLATVSPAAVVPGRGLSAPPLPARGPPAIA